MYIAVVLTNYYLNLKENIMYNVDGKNIVTSKTLNITCKNIVAPYALHCNNFIRIYFAAHINNFENIYFIDLCKDGTIYFSKNPIFELGEKGCFDEEGISSISVIEHSEGCSCYYTGVITCESVPYDKAIGFAHSNDGGERFSRLDKGPILGYSLYEPFVVAYPRVIKNGNLWVMTYTAGKKWANQSDELCSNIRIATSADGVNWNKMNKQVITGDGENQLHPDLFFHNGKYYILFNYALEGSSKMQLGCAWSSDLNTWHREAINFNEVQHNEVLYPHFVVINNQTYLLYVVNNESESCLRIGKINLP